MVKKISMKKRGHRRTSCKKYKYSRKISHKASLRNKRKLRKTRKTRKTRRGGKKSYSKKNMKVMRGG